MRTRKDTGRAFILSLSAALLTAVAVSGVMIALERMESTLHPEPYTLFSLDQLPQNRLALTALNEEYLIDCSAIPRFQKKLSRLESAVGPRARLLFGSLSALSELVSNSLR